MQFHPFAEKLPMMEGQEWEAFKDSVRKTKGNEEPVLYRKVKGKEEGLDGRNRLRACAELKIKCNKRLVSIKDEDVKDFILRKNILRRHLTKEARQAIVAELRADGESERQIAGALGVSQATVHRDIAGDSNESPDAPNIGNNEENGSDSTSEAPRVTGKDGKEYPARRKQILCARCKRVGAVADCPACADARKKAGISGQGKRKKRAKKPKTTREEVKDKVGNVVPDSCRDAFADPSLGELIAEVEGVENLTEPEHWLSKATKLMDHYPFMLLTKFKEHIFEAKHRLQCALDSIKAGVPYAVCPKFEKHEKGKVCRTCRDCGHIPEHRATELANEPV